MTSPVYIRYTIGGGLPTISRIYMTTGHYVYSLDQVDLLVAIKNTVDAIPNNPLLTNDIRLDHLDADISSRSIPANITSAVSDIKGYGNKDLTEVYNNTPTIDNVAVADAVRTELTPELDKINTNLDAKVSTV